MDSTLHSLAERRDVELGSEDEALASIEAAATVPVGADAARAALPEKGVTVALHLALARALHEDGEVDDADRIRFQVVERLNQEGFWRAVAVLAAELLERHPGQAAPLLLRARTNGGGRAVSDDLLLDAHDHLPHHGQLAWAAAQSLEARGDGRRARRAARLAFPELLDDRRYAEADEALLLAVEEEDDAAAHSAIRALEILARQGEWARFAAVLEVAGDLLARPGAVHGSWRAVQHLWLKHPNPEALRASVVKLAEAYLATFPDPAAILRVSRLAVPSEDPQECLERLRRAATLAPGYYAAHSAWGIGRIRDNDTDAIVVDFPQKPMHRMSYATAERALEALPPEDLRVLKAMRPDELARLLADEPAEALVRTLRRLPDGEGSVETLRKTLVPSILPTTGWAGWWKRARAAAVEDRRIDARRAYENIFRLRASHDAVEEVDLPAWNPRLDVAKNVSLLDTFLEHHPDAQGDLLDEHGPHMIRLARDTKLPVEDRLLLALWVRAAGGDPGVDIEAMATAPFDPNAFGKQRQDDLVAAVRGVPALRSLLDSRLAGTRRDAWMRIGEADARPAVAEETLGAAAERPEAALFLMTEALAAGEIPEGHAWTARLLDALTELLEKAPRDTHRKRALALLDPSGDLADRLAAFPLDEAEATKLITRLKAWQSSDKFRFPLLDFLRETAHGAISEAVEGHRLRSAARMARRAEPSDDPYDGDLVLARATLDRLEAERRRIGMELKTTIPAAIQRARELGDLRENAEYAAAKAKQIEYAKRFQELDGMLKRVRLVESVDRTSGAALPGTEVRFEAADGGPAPDPAVVWLLGEGDQALGEAVVSYRAPMGKAMHGKRPGEEFELRQGTSDRRFRITEIRERLP